MSNGERSEPVSPTIPAEERFAPGEQCGVCHFPTGTGQICGNPVYAVAGKGALPKYCGMANQEQYQAAHGTDGVAGHLSERAGYPRKQFGMDPAEVKRLAKELAESSGVHRRTPVVPVSNDGAPEKDSTATESASREGDARMRVRGLAGGGTDHSARLAEYLLAAAELAAALGDEMTALRAEADTRVGREASLTRAAVADKEQAERALRETRESTRITLEQAEQLQRDAQERAEAAHAAQLRAEGELSAAQKRIEALETQQARHGDIEARHRAEIERVRAEESARTDRILEQFTRATAGHREQGSE
jgi:hypothetical protein